MRCRDFAEKDPKTKNPILDWRLMHLLSENSPNFKYKDGDPFDPWTFEDIKRLKDTWEPSQDPLLPDGLNLAK